MRSFKYVASIRIGRSLPRIWGNQRVTKNRPIGALFSATNRTARKLQYVFNVNRHRIEVDYQNASDRKGSVAQEKMHRRDCRMASDDLSVRRQSWEERTPLPAQKMLAVFSSHCYAGSCSRGQCSVVVVT